jgi:hypothetical protein
MFFAQRLEPGIARGVVDDDDRVRARGRVLAQRGKAARQILDAVVMDDDDGEFQAPTSATAAGPDPRRFGPSSAPGAGARELGFPSGVTNHTTYRGMGGEIRAVLASDRQEHGLA